MYPTTFYLDHKERYPKLSSMEREQYPDEIFIYGWGIIKREKNFEDMTKEDFNEHREYILLAAKDIPISEGMKE